jgi:hypothetical protein
MEWPKALYEIIGAKHPIPSVIIAAVVGAFIFAFMWHFVIGGEYRKAVAAKKALEANTETPTQPLTPIPEITNVRLVIESVKPKNTRFHYEIENGEVPIKIFRTMEQTPNGWDIENILPGGARAIARHGKLTVSGVLGSEFKENDYNELGIQLWYRAEVGGSLKDYLYSCRFLIQPESLQPSASFYPVWVNQKQL